MPVPDMSRRTFFLGSVVAVAAAGAAFGPGAVAIAAESNTTVLRDRWRSIMIGGNPPSTTAIASQIDALSLKASDVQSSMLTGSGRTALWSDLPLGTASGSVWQSFQRLRLIALALATPGHPLTNDAGLSASLNDGLQFLTTKYKDGGSTYDNWWHWEIGAPRSIVDTLTLAWDQVAPATRSALLDAVKWFAPNPNKRGRGSTNETGANRADKAFIAALRGILSADPATIASGRDAISDAAGGGANSVLRYTTSGDGFYADGGYIQHTYLPYTGTYGAVALLGVAELVTLLSTSDWAVTDPGLGVVFDSVERSFAPFMRNGRVLECVRGRSVSREDEPDFYWGFSVLDAVLLLSEANTPHSADFRSIAKRWIATNSSASPIGNPLGTVSLSERAYAVQQSSSSTAGDPNTVMFIPSIERFVARRSTWVFAVNTSSSRIGRYEWGNYENNTGWYQGDGMTFLHLDADPDHYSDDYWPTINPYRLPGTIVDSANRVAGASSGTSIPRASQAFAGGVAIGSDWGTVAMDHRNHNGSVTGFLSWYIFNDVIIGLGSNIRATSGTSFHGTVENRAFPQGQTPASLNLDGTDQTLPLSTSGRAVSSYVHVPDLGGYIKVPSGQNTLNWSVMKTRRMGTWNTINSGYSSSSRTRDFVNIHMYPSAAPTSSSFAYAILPRAGLSATQAWHGSPPVKVDAQTDTVHIVRSTDGTVTLANLLASTSGGVVSGVGSTAPVSLAIRKNGAQTDIVIAHPPRTHSTATITVGDVSATSTVRKDPGVTVTSYSPLTLTLDFANLRGSALTLTVA